MADDLADDLQACRALLSEIASSLKWAAGAGWWPSRRWVGEPAGREMRLADAEAERRDQVPGRPDDIGLADYAARAAVRAAGPKLSEASQHLGRVTVLCAASWGARTVPRLAAVHRSSTLAELLAAVATVDRQAEHALASGADRLNAPARARAASEAQRALRVLDGIDRGLDRWAELSPAGRSLPVSLCVTCLHRPRPVRAGKLHGRECDTCATWRARHNGRTRPQSLDDRDREAVAEAQRRRDAAGMGYGWS